MDERHRKGKEVMFDLNDSWNENLNWFETNVIGMYNIAMYKTQINSLKGVQKNSRSQDIMLKKNKMLCKMATMG